MEPNKAIKPPVEIRYKEELEALSALDTGRRPLNWKLSNIPLRAAIDGEFCFAEDIPSSEIVYAMQHHGIEAVWLYRWNRSYPGDNFFPLDMTAPPWKKVSETELKGHSHPSILEEIYEAVC